MIVVSVLALASFFWFLIFCNAEEGSTDGSSTNESPETGGDAGGQGQSTETGASANHEAGGLGISLLKVLLLWGFMLILFLVFYGCMSLCSDDDRHRNCGSCRCLRLHLLR